MPLIADDDLLTLNAVLFALAWLGFWADQHRLARKVSGALWVIAGGMLLSNVRITPFGSASYQFVINYLVPLAIPLLLLKADLRRIFRESGRVMLTFLVASLCTLTAALISYFLVGLGDGGAQVAGVIAAGYIGGTMNFVAVAQAVGMPPALFSMTMGANTLVSVLALMALITLPSVALITRYYPSRKTAVEMAAAAPADHSEAAAELRLTHLSFALGYSFSICVLAVYLAQLLSVPQYSILFVTAIAVLAANIAPRKLSRIKGGFELGMLMMYLFFAAIGLSTDVTGFIDSALNLFCYALLLVVLHLILVLLLAKVLGFELPEALIGSAAALVGPGPAAAIAAAKGWHNLVMPGIMCGLFGYVIANFIGVSLTRWLG